MTKLKLVFLASVSALGIAAAGSASAAINPDDASHAGGDGTGNGELFLSVVDRGGATERSYVLDLGITANQLLSNDASLVNNLSFTADANLLDILGNQSGTIAWNIAAVHNINQELDPPSNYDNMGYLSTAPLAPTPSNVPTGFAGISGALSKLSSYINSVNGTSTDYAANISQIFSSTANAFYDGTLWGDMWNLSHSTEGGLDSSLGFYFVAMDFDESASDPTAQSRVQTLLGQWTLDSAGTLSYVADVGAPQVPVPAAVWLLGSALVGMAGIGRRRKVEAATA